MSVLKDLSDSMAEAVEKVSDSLVQVNARRRLPATGIVWSSDGLIVTANHIVERDNIDVVIMGTKGETNRKEITFGSNTLQVIKYVKCPVLAIPDDFIYEKPGY